MPDTPTPQDAQATDPVVDADQTTPPTPQGRTDNADDDAPGDGPSTGQLDADGDD